MAKKQAKAKRWQWREGAPRYKIKASVVGAIIDRLSADGPVSPERLVEEARPKDSPIHSLIFDRGTYEAAEEYYKHRASHILRCCRVIYESPAGEEKIQVGYINVEDNGIRGYLPTEDVMSREDLYQQAYQNTLRMLKGVRSRLECIRELRGVAEAIDNALAQEEEVLLRRKIATHLANNGWTTTKAIAEAFEQTVASIKKLLQGHEWFDHDGQRWNVSSAWDR